MLNKMNILIFIIMISNILKAKSLPHLEERMKYNNTDFVFDLAGSKPTTNGLAGTGRSVNVESLPSLAGEGVAMVIFHIDPCGINLPHVHPRATELFFVVEGTFKTSFIEENTGRTIVNVLKPGQATFFPHGLIHEEQNIGCEPATFISAFSSDDPGVLTISNRLFTLPEEALTSTFNITMSQVDQIRKNLPTNPAKGTSECLNRCSLLNQSNNTKTSTKKSKTTTKKRRTIFNFF